MAIHFKITKLIRQFIAFFGISGIGWCIDVGIYMLLNQWMEAVYANLISATVGVSFVFWVSTRKTFYKNLNRISIRGKYCIYLIYQCCAITVASFVIGMIKNMLLYYGGEILINYSNILAKIMVTPFTMILNFLFMKLLIEKI